MVFHRTEYHKTTGYVILHEILLTASLVKPVNDMMDTIQDSAESMLLFVADMCAEHLKEMICERVRTVPAGNGMDCASRAAAIARPVTSTTTIKAPSAVG